MCGRYFIDMGGDDIQDIIKRAGGRNEFALRNRFAPGPGTAKHDKIGSARFNGGEIFPSDIAPVITAADVQAMIWGFPGFKQGQILINARSETAAVRQTFKNAFIERRCIVPASSYFEWQGRQKYEFRLSDGSALFFAGIYSADGRFAILTRAAAPCVAAIHDRMPVIIPREYAGAWFESPDVMADALTELTYAPAEQTEIYPQLSIYDD